MTQSILLQLVLKRSLEVSGAETIFNYTCPQIFFWNLLISQTNKKKNCEYFLTIWLFADFLFFLGHFSCLENPALFSKLILLSPLLDFHVFSDDIRHPETPLQRTSKANACFAFSHPEVMFCRRNSFSMINLSTNLFLRKILDKILCSYEISYAISPQCVNVVVNLNFKYENKDMCWTTLLIILVSWNLSSTFYLFARFILPLNPRKVSQRFFSVLN